VAFLAPLGVLLVVNGVALAVFTMPRTLQQRNYAQRLAALRKEVEVQRQHADALASRAATIKENEADQQRFFREVVKTREAGLVPLVAELEKVAADPGLKSGARNYTPEEVKGLPLVRVGARVTIKGGYAELVGFLSKVERTKAFVSVDRVQLSHSATSEEGGSEGNLAVELSAYFRNGSEG
jgi:Tfp pilus assembly protein PilO